MSKKFDVNVRNMYDIKKIIEDFKFKQDVVVATKFKSKDDNGNVIEEIVTAPAVGDYRTLIMDGFKSLAKRTAISAKLGDKASKLISMDYEMSIDKLISTYMGGSRNGSRIKWVVQDGTFEYDPILDKLFKLS